MKKSSSIIKYASLIAVMAMSMTSCRTTYTFESLIPARYTLPQGIDTVLVVCSVPPTVWSDTSIFNGPSQQKVIESELRLPAMVCSLTWNEFCADNYLPCKPFSRYYPYELLRTKSDSICAATNTNAILILKDMDYNATASISQNKTTNGIQVHTQVTTVKGACQWAFMTPNGNSMETEVFRDSVYWKYRAIDLNELAQSIPNPTERTYVIAERLANKLTSAITPSWATMNREIFFTQSNKFMSAVNSLQNGDFESARNSLYTIHEKSRKANKIRAAIDMSLTFEAQGDVESALIWIYKASDLLQGTRGMKYEKEYVENITSDLQRRKGQLVKLDKQMRK